MMLAFDLKKTGALIEQGDQAALLHGLVSQAALWFALAGSDLSLRHAVGAVNCLCLDSPRDQALLAAARDLCDVLELSPQGRKALANFRRQPILEQPEGE